MDPAPAKEAYEEPSMIEWLKEKWKTVTGVIVGIVLSLFAAFGMMLRLRKQKEVLAHANKSHEAENRANLDAMKNLDNGLTKIASDKDKSLEEINENFENDLKDMREERDDIATAEKEDGDLGKKLANVIGADFVKTDD